MKNKPRFIAFLAIFCAISISSLYLRSKEFWMHWTQMENATGYKVYYGTVSKKYSEVVEVGLEGKYHLTGLNPLKTYYVAVSTIYNESDAAFEEGFLGCPDGLGGRTKNGRVESCLTNEVSR